MHGSDEVKHLKIRAETIRRLAALQPIAGRRASDYNPCSAGAPCKTDVGCP